MNPLKRFYPLTPEQRAAVLRRIDAAELAEFRPKQWNAAERPEVSEGTASAQRLQDAMRTGGLRLVPMGDAVAGNMGQRRTPPQATQQHRPAMTGDPYRLDDGIPVLSDVAGQWRARRPSDEPSPIERVDSPAGAATVIAVIFAVCIAGVVAITLFARAG